ncbi:NAD-dependent epimerase/dehydratase family protein [Nonomuraea sp. NPDC005501]
MDAIVFGATGFVGRHLVAELLGRGSGWRQPCEPTPSPPG